MITEIVGLNNNEYQVTRARRIAEASGLAGQASYLKGDFMSIFLLFFSFFYFLSSFLIHLFLFGYCY